MTHLVDRLELSEPISHGLGWHRSASSCELVRHLGTWGKKQCNVLDYMIGLTGGSDNIYHCYAEQLAQPRPKIDCPSIIASSQCSRDIEVFFNVPAWWRG